MIMFVPTISAPIGGFISDNLLFICVRLPTICFLLSHFVSEIFNLFLLIILFFAPDNQPKVTEAIRKVLKDDYNYDSTVRIILSTLLTVV